MLAMLGFHGRPRVTPAPHAAHSPASPAAPAAKRACPPAPACAPRPRPTDRSEGSSGGPAPLPRPTLSSREGGAPSRPGALRGGESAGVRDAVSRLIQCKALTHTSRSAAQALATSGAPAAMAQLSIYGEGEAILLLQRTTTMGPARVSAMSQWEVFCARKGTAPIYPITLTLAAAYISFYSVDKGNFSHVLDGAMSNLRRAAIASGVWDVSPEDEKVLADCMRSLQGVLPSASKKSAGINLDELLPYMTALAQRTDAASARTGAQLATAMGFKMRGVEVYGDRGVRRSDLHLVAQGAFLEAKLTKMGMRSLDARPRAAPHLPPQYAFFCTSWWLKRYLSKVDPMGTMPGDAYLFCPLSPEGRWTGGTPDGDRESTTLFALLEAGGVRTGSLNVEWGRHTGYDLHRLKCHLSSDDCSMLGDHRQESSTGKKHYTHTERRGADVLVIGYQPMVANWGKLCCE